MYINSPGGVVTSGLSIYDTMQYIKPKVSTLVIGQAASMGSLLLQAGEKGMRFSLPNSRVMVHQPSGGYQGQATDIMIHAQETQKLKTRLNEIYVKHTGQPLEKVEAALERDNFMSPEEAKDWGLIDEIVENRGKMDDPDAPKDGDKKGGDKKGRDRKGDKKGDDKKGDEKGDKQGDNKDDKNGDKKGTKFQNKN